MAKQIINREKILELLQEVRGTKTESAKDNTRAPKDYNLLKAIRSEKEYKSNVGRRDRRSRKVLEESNEVKSKGSIIPGQLIMFNYFEPKTKEELEYYDAMPVTIFFNVFKTELGDRVLGFNIHYYPPRIRWQIMNRIYEIFKPIYDKSWGEPMSKKIAGMNYQLLLEQLESQGLTFGVRMYDPKLMAKIIPIKFKDWSKAALTEGVFKKRTRDAIMNYWQNEFGKKNKRKQQKQSKTNQK